MKKKKPGRPRLGKEKKTILACRLEPRIKFKILKNFGSFQKWIDYLTKDYL